MFSNSIGCSCAFKNSEPIDLMCLSRYNTQITCNLNKHVTVEINKLIKRKDVKRVHFWNNWEDEVQPPLP